MKKKNLAKWIEQFSLAVASGICGVVLYRALFPEFYYMIGFGLVLGMWGIVSA